MIEQLFISSLLSALLLGQIGRIELFGKLVNGYIQDPVMFLFILYLVIRHGLKPFKQVLKRNVSLFLTGTIIFSFLLSLLEFTIIENAVSLLFLLRIAMYGTLGIYLHFIAEKEKYTRIFIEKALKIFSVLLILISFAQYFFYSNFWGFYAFGWDPHMYRMSATYLDVYVAAALYGILALYWYGKKNILFTLIFVICLVLSFSRSSYIAFLLSAFLFLILNKQWKQLTITVLLFALFVFVAPKPFGEGVSLMRTSSVYSRIHDYQTAITIWEKKPLFGYGYNRIRYAKERLHLLANDDITHAASAFHSSFLIILATTGIVGLLAFFLALMQYGITHQSIASTLFFICIMSLFDNALLHVLVLLPLILVGSISSIKSK